MSNIPSFLMEIVAGMAGNLIYIISAHEKIPYLRLLQIVAITCMISPFIYPLAFAYTKDVTIAYAACVFGGYCGPPIIRFTTSSLQQLTKDPQKSWETIITIIKFWNNKK